LILDVVAKKGELAPTGTAPEAAAEEALATPIEMATPANGTALTDDAAASEPRASAPSTR